MRRTAQVVLGLSTLLLGAGALLAYAALRPTAPYTGPSAHPADAPLHPVTARMEREAALWTAKPAPRFTLTDTRRRPVTLGTSERPQFVYFVKDGCPCSIDAEPLLQKLERLHRKDVDFVAVTDATTKKADEWVTDMAVVYPVVSRPTVDVMKAYGALASVHSSLIVDGKVVKTWPGYSKDILGEMNRAFSKAAGMKLAPPFDPAYAPIKKTAGCAFSMG